MGSRVRRLVSRVTKIGNGSMGSITNQARILGKRTTGRLHDRRLPDLLALIEHLLDLLLTLDTLNGLDNVDPVSNSIDSNKIAILDKGDGAAGSRLGDDVADDKTVRSTRVTAVGDERDVSKAGAHDRR